MTYCFEIIKNLVHKRNIGALLYLLLNSFIITWVFSSNFENIEGVFLGLMVYACSLMIALSPIGEWVVMFQAGGTKLKRKEHKNRLEPLFDEVYRAAKANNPSVPDGVKLYISADKGSKASAMGRKSICISSGLLQCSDAQIKAAIAEELGHLTYRTADLIMMIKLGNFIVVIFFIFYRIVSYIVMLSVAYFNESFSDIIYAVLVDLFLVALMKIWTAIGIALVYSTQEENNIAAQDFAYTIGYGSAN